MLILDETTGDLDIDRGPVERGFSDGDPALVVRIGSLGKTVWGGLRVGWIRGQSELIRRLVAARSAHDLGTPEFEQAVAARAAAAIRARSRHSVRTCCAPVATPLRQRWRAVCRSGAFRTPDGGVSLWIELDAPLSSALVMDVRSRGLLLSAGPRFSVDGGHDRHLRLPFTAPAEDLEKAVDILAEAWPQVRAGAPVVASHQLESVV